MGMCTSNIIYCKKPSVENNEVIINLDENKDRKNMNKDGGGGDKKVQKSNDESVNNNDVVVYRLQSRFKSKLMKSYLSNNGNIQNFSNFKPNQIIKYNVTNDKFDKLIHFTNFSNNISFTTNSIIK